VKTLVLFLGLLLAALPLEAAPTIEVYFSPHGGATEAIVKELATAKNTITIQAYSFTSVAIAKAIVEARKRGVDVLAILDKENETAHYSAATFLVDASIPVLIDYLPKIAHSKVMVIDGKDIITGSFNFTKAAEEGNVENLLIIHDDPDLADKYAANFKARAAVSRPYSRQ